MMKIIHTSPDGGLSVTNPAEGARLAHSVTLADGTIVQSGSGKPSPVDALLRRWPVAGAVAEWAEMEAEFVARIAEKDVPADAVDMQIVNESAIPTDRTFRNAWKSAPGRVEHDLPKCKAMAHERRRERREAEFKPHDDVIAKQIPGNDPAVAEAKRQAIRDKYDAMQAAIDVASSVDEIKAALA